MITLRSYINLLRIPSNYIWTQGIQKKLWYLYDSQEVGYDLCMNSKKPNMIFERKQSSFFRVVWLAINDIWSSYYSQEIINDICGFYRKSSLFLVTKPSHQLWSFSDYQEIKLNPIWLRRHQLQLLSNYQEIIKCPRRFAKIS